MLSQNIVKPLPLGGGVVKEEVYMSENKSQFKEILLKKSQDNRQNQKYFLLFIRIEQMLNEEKNKWLSKNKTFIEVKQKPFIYLDKRLFNSILNFALWCFIAHLLIMPMYSIDKFTHLREYYGLATILNGFILHFLMSFRLKSLTLLSINFIFERSVMDRDFFDKLLSTIPEHRLQDKKDMLDILSKYSYGYNGVAQYMSMLAKKIMTTSKED